MTNVKLNAKTAALVALLCITNGKVYADETETQLGMEQAQMEAEVDEQEQKVLTIRLQGLYNADFESGGVRADLIYNLSPNDRAYEFSLGFDYFDSYKYEVESLEVSHDISNFRAALGYRWQVKPQFSITPSLGLAIVTGDVLYDETTVIAEDKKVELGDSQVYAQVDFGYKLNSSFELVGGITQDFGNDALDSSTSVGIGFKYRFGSLVKGNAFEQYQRQLEQEQMEQQAEQEQQALEAEIAQQQEVVEPEPVAPEQVMVVETQQVTVLNPTVSSTEVPEPTIDKVDETPVPIIKEDLTLTEIYTVQIASFTSADSLEPFLQQNKLGDQTAIVRLVDGQKKLNIGLYRSKLAALKMLNKLEQQGVEGFLVTLLIEDFE